ncbi:hypothetical protein BGZ89_000628 [Linnemannia elongata]|nr:hypothetical protein BGZ89_000628 [Linnemannia elongata]
MAKNIGLFYEEGHGVVKGTSKAAIWYNKAAYKGSAKAQSNLGILYIKGDGVEKNNALAMQWFVMAAKQGNTSAQFDLGCMYYRDEGVPENRDMEAMTWFSKAEDMRLRWRLTRISKMSDLFLI